MACPICVRPRPTMVVRDGDVLSERREDWKVRRMRRPSILSVTSPREER
jgi:hypothetical protein